MRTQVDQRSTEAGERLGGVVSDVRSVSDQLREQGKDGPAKLADQAAERADKVSRYLQDSDADRILGDVEDFGRKQPWAVIAGGVALGLVASRFLKASSSRRYEQRSPSSNRLPARTYDVSPRTSGIDYAGPAQPRRRPRRTATSARRPRRPASSEGSDAWLTPRPTARAVETDDPRERPIGELVKDLSSQTSTLVRKEIELARAELQQQGKVAGKGVGMLVGGAVFGLLALIALTAMLIAVLDTAMDTWLAALIVTVLWVIVAAVLAKAGQSALKRVTPPAPQTVETVKEDIQWAKNPTESVQR